MNDVVLVLILIVILTGFAYGCYKFFQMKNKNDVFEKLKNAADNQAAATINAANKRAADIVDEANKKANEIKIKTAQSQQSLNTIISTKTLEIKELDKQIESLTKEATVNISGVMNEDSLAAITSEEVKTNLIMIKKNEKDLIEKGKAIALLNTVSDKKALNNNVRQLLRCYNAECENYFTNINFKNIDSIKSHIQKSFDTLNKIFTTDNINLTDKMLVMKLDEATLLYSYYQKKEQEKEQQKAIREQMVEEEKVRRELEKKKQSIEKDEKQFNTEISKLMAYMSKSVDTVQNQLYSDKIKELEEKLKALEGEKKDVATREENARAGFVYVISNIGSFGEDVYKIGMTRRLEPMDRIDELSSASVPFEFDVHAMIFSGDAPTLEAKLHQVFEKYRVNKVNERKEFYKVPLKEIEEEVKKNHNATVEFTLLAQAKEYRETLRLAAKDTAQA